MKNVLSLASLLFIIFSGAAFAADPVVGLYQTQRDDDGNFGHVEIYPCGATICGVIRKAFNSLGEEVESDKVGKPMIWDMVSQGDGAYANGKIWAPDRDKIYKSRMSFAGRTLKVSGCVFGICRSQTWTRLN